MPVVRRNAVIAAVGNACKIVKGRDTGVKLITAQMIGSMVEQCIYFLRRTQSIWDRHFRGRIVGQTLYVLFPCFRE